MNNIFKTLCSAYLMWAIRVIYIIISYHYNEIRTQWYVNCKLRYEYLTINWKNAVYGTTSQKKILKKNRFASLPYRYKIAVLLVILVCETEKNNREITKRFLLLLIAVKTNVSQSKKKTSEKSGQVFLEVLWLI